MSDPRTTPANERVAHVSLRGQVDAARFVEGEAARIGVPLVDLCRTPDWPRDRQLVFGDEVLVLETRDGHAFVQARKDGYVGYVGAEALAPLVVASHVVTARRAQAYDEPDIKSPDVAGLSFGAALAGAVETAGFLTVPGLGHVPLSHVAALPHRFDDPVAVAELFLGTPYLWGGNSGLGIDCSGLVQAALLACGIACPGDSDMQAALGAPVADGSYRRGDLLFWPGHVALVADARTLIHANAHHMAVVHEPIDRACDRIASAGDGPLTGHRRL